MNNKILKVYLETTIPNYLYANDTPREMDITRKFWRIIHKKYDCFISRLVVDEIERTSNPDKRKLLLKSIEGIRVLSITDECRKLAEIYVSKNIIPSRYEPDAMHIAIATLNKLDILVTWNMDHMANPKTRITIRDENERLGYKVIDIATPEEVISIE